MKYFNKYTKNRKKGKYQILILNKYKNYKSKAFQVYYKKNNIIYLYLLLHSNHLIQLFDIDCFNNLKYSYNNQINRFIKIYINHILKIEFFIAFKTIYKKSIIFQNIKSGFRGTNLILFNPEIILSKLNIQIHISTPPSFNLN